MNQYFPKLIQLDAVTSNSEPTVQLVRPQDWTLPHVKVGSESLDYIRHVKAVPNETIILVLAMSAGEYYGPNRNGDAWSERPLRAGNTEIKADEVLPECYKTFETHANVFKHHVNKDPHKRIGRVLRAFYNWDMHRVELLLSLLNREAEDIVQRIETGEFPAVSMGCKIPYDVCSICGHKAPNRSHYCSHAKFQLTKYLPNGKQVFVWNPKATFFDISVVRRPADRIGFMMKKVADYIPEIRSSAELGEYVDIMAHKLSDARKLSDISKVIHGDIAATKEDTGDMRIVRDFSNRVAQPVAAATPPLDATVIREMLRHRPAEVLSTLSSMGLFLTTPEFLKYFVWQLVPDAQIPTSVLERATDVQQQVFDILAQNPDLIEEVENSGFLDINPENIRPELISKFTPLLEKRSQHAPHLSRRLVEAVLKKSATDLSPDEGHWDLFEVADPVSGQRYRTTRRAINDARTQASSMRSDNTLRNIFGGGALLSGAYKLTGHKLPKPAPYAQAAYAHPFVAHTGETVPGMTEVKSAALHIAHENAMRCRCETVALNLQNTKHAAMLLSEANFDSIAHWLGKVIYP